MPTRVLGLFYPHPKLIQIYIARLIPTISSAIRALPKFLMPNSTPFFWKAYSFCTKFSGRSDTCFYTTINTTRCIIYFYKLITGIIFNFYGASLCLKSEKTIDWCKNLIHKARNFVNWNIQFLICDLEVYDYA